MVLLAALAGDAVDGGEALPSGLLAADDECGGGSGGAAREPGACAISALQLASRAAGKAAAAAPASAPADGDADEAQLLPPAANAFSVGVGNGTQKYSCPLVPYHGPPEGPESCFCHKAQNPACAARPCTCREGCDELAVMQGRQTVTFRNRAKAACVGAMLTIPRPYFTDISNLKLSCPGDDGLLADMLADGFRAYESVHGGPAMQCIHKPDHVSVRWLHLHTFCPGHTFEGMPGKATSYCALMSSEGQASDIAAQLLAQVR